jgi:hypothetical protein
VTLTDGDVAALARQAVDLLDPDIEIRIDPKDPVDPYRFGAQSWLIHTFGVDVYASAADSYAETLARIIDQLSEYGSESERFWGRAIPPCPGHSHPARVTVEEPVVVLRCPDTGDVVARIRPEVPA